MTSSEIIHDLNKYVMATYNRIPITFEKGEGSWLIDKEGKKYLDFTTGIAVTNLGHTHEKIVKTIVEQVQNVIHVSNLFNIEQQAKLAKLLVENSFADKAFFCNSGTEAVEAAIKLARKWGKENGNKYKIISTYGGFHGRTLGSLSATGTRKYQQGFTPLLDGFIFAEYGNIENLKELISDEQICAVILEPIQGENGVILPPSGYIKEVRRMCDENNILLILDEIQIGIGRTGKLFGYQHEDIEPDIISLAKALGNGIPCGAILAKDEIARHFTPGTHGTTFGGNPLAMAAASTVIDTILSGNLLDNCSELGEYFLKSLKSIKEEYPAHISEVRGRGLILGLEFEDKAVAKNVFQHCIEKGLLVILTVENVFRILPPLNTNRNEINTALRIINQSIKEVTSNG